MKWFFLFLLTCCSLVAQPTVGPFPVPGFTPYTGTGYWDYDTNTMTLTGSVAPQVNATWGWAGPSGIPWYTNAINHDWSNFYNPSDSQWEIWSNQSMYYRGGISGGLSYIYPVYNQWNTNLANWRTGGVGANPSPLTTWPLLTNSSFPYFGINKQGAYAAGSFVIGSPNSSILGAGQNQGNAQGMYLIETLSSQAYGPGCGFIGGGNSTVWGLNVCSAVGGNVYAYCPNGDIFLGACEGLYVSNYNGQCAFLSARGTNNGNLEQSMINSQGLSDVGCNAFSGAFNAFNYYMNGSYDSVIGIWGVAGGSRNTLVGDYLNNASATDVYMFGEGLANPGNLVDVALFGVTNAYHLALGTSNLFVGAMYGKATGLTNINFAGLQSQSTNYVAANFSPPLAGLVNYAISNNAIYAITDHSTNKILTLGN